MTHKLNKHATDNIEGKCKKKKQTDPLEKPGHFELEKSVHSVQSKQITGKIDSQHIIIILANTLLIEKN